MELFDAFVVVVDVGFVVFVVMEFHDSAADDGLEGAVGVGEVGELDGSVVGVDEAAVGFREGEFAEVGEHCEIVGVYK